jgi:biopolymer transport protein ExbB/TolQ
MNLLAQTYFGDILHTVTQVLLVPATVALLLLILYAIWCIGSVVVEAVLERRHFKVVMPDFLDDIIDATPEELPVVINKSGLLGRQKRVLLTIWDYRILPVETHVALAKRLIDEQDARLNRIVQRTQTVSKVAPMLGLMGTLIPLGPGIVSLGTGNTTELSNSLLIAFDTTVAGLVTAIVTFVVSRLRKNWYEDYMTALEASVTAMLEKIDGLRQEGKIEITEPTQFAKSCKGRR